MPFRKGDPKPPNSGRRKNVRNKANAEREAAIAASGLTPLDYMLQTLRDESLDKQDRQWAAQAAAPYVHPKLSNIEAKVEGDMRVEEVRDTIVDPRD